MTAGVIYNIIKRLIMQHGFIKGVSQARRLGLKPKQIQKAFRKPALDRVNKNALHASDAIGLQMPERAGRLYETVKLTNPKLANTYTGRMTVSGKPVRSTDGLMQFARRSEKESIKRGDFSSLIDDADEISSWG